MRADSFGEDERLAHVVVGAAVEPGDALFGRRLRAEDQHGQLGFLARMSRSTWNPDRPGSIRSRTTQS